MKQNTKNLRNHVLSMRVNSHEWGVIKSCAQQSGTRVSEVMRDVLKNYLQRNTEHSY